MTSWVRWAADETERLFSTATVQVPPTCEYCSKKWSAVRITARAIRFLCGQCWKREYLRDCERTRGES